MREDPSQVLSAVQIGVTFAGFLAASYGGATLAVELGRVLVRFGLSESCGFHSRVGAGQSSGLLRLAGARRTRPKRLAMQRTEAVALVVAPVQAAEYLSDRSHSRYSVTGDSPDDILSGAHVRDVLTAVHRRDLGQDAPATVAALSREAPCYPATSH